MVGLISFGAYVPSRWITIEEIANAWGADGKTISSSLGVRQKAVASFDEDAVTLGYEAAENALKAIAFDPEKIEALFVGSESHPYAVNPTSTTIGEFLGAGRNYFSSDLEFACKAATTGLIVTTSLLQAGKASYGLVIAADCAQAKPHDLLEYTASSAAAAFLIGSKKQEIIAEIIDYASYSSDTPDLWRRDGMAYPSHGGRFTKEPAYFTHVLGASKKLLAKTKMEPSDFTYCVFHMPNGKFPKEAGKRLGFSERQLKNSLTVEKLGNPYSASALIGLVGILEQAKEEELIFLSSYGSGAGADAFIFKTTANLKKIQNKHKKIAHLLDNSKKQISYAEYLKMRGHI